MPVNSNIPIRDGVPQLLHTCSLSVHHHDTALLQHLSYLSISAEVMLGPLRHIHYRLGQSCIDVLQDLQFWISIGEMVALLVFIALAYNKYKELRAKDNSDKPHEFFG